MLVQFEHNVMKEFQGEPKLEQCQDQFEASKF